MSSSWILFLGAVSSLLVCLSIVWSVGWHGAWSLDTHDGLQKLHTNPTPRVGGLGVVVGVWVVWLLLPAVEARIILGQLLLAGSLAFVVGLAEDVTKRVGVSPRLLGTMAAGVLACWISGVSLTHVGLWGGDALLSIGVVSVLFSAFAIAGVANSINIIDGLNGLAGLTSFWILAGIALVSVQVGDPQLASVALGIAACVLGFFVVNWPLGKIFMGDGGSYFIGFAIAWLCVLLVERNAAVTPFVALLLCYHPITEVLVSIYRRLARRAHPGHPDHLHLHSLVKRRYLRRWLSAYPWVYRNSAAGLLTSLLTLPAVALSVLVYANTWQAVLTLGAMVALYLMLFRRMLLLK
jgi:UDP-N-acetylmuramyl pentapeptide phosphotransferase/UDP-N-acetylglucosamine-1-phosphate transferase